MALAFTDSNIKEYIAGDKLVVVDFWAEWCGPCRVVGPVIEEIAQDFDGKAVVGKLNVDENPQTAEEFGIRNIPTILFFKKGQLVDKHVGGGSKEFFAEKINAHL